MELVGIFLAVLSAMLVRDWLREWVSVEYRYAVGLWPYKKTSLLHWPHRITYRLLRPRHK